MVIVISICKKIHYHTLIHQFACIYSELELKKNEEEKEKIQRQVDSQPISPDDVERMHKESEQITNKRNIIAGKMKEINKLQWEKKLELEKEIIELEHLIQNHNSNLFRIGLLPSSSRLANGENFELSINVEADRIEKMISSDLKDTVRVIYTNNITLF